MRFQQLCEIFVLEYFDLLLIISLTIKCDFKGSSGHALVFNHVAEEEHHHAGIYLYKNTTN